MKKLGIIYAPRDSASAAALAAAVPLYRAGKDGFRSAAGKRAATRPNWQKRAHVVNWGASSWGWLGEQFPDEWHLNYPLSVGYALSKLKSLTKLKEAGVPALEVTSEAQVAAQWVSQGMVLGRKDGLSGGQGITKYNPGDVLQAHDFYVKYWKKNAEYRVHVFDGKVIDIQQKRRRLDFPTDQYDPMIRNFDNGWVFCHDNLKGTEAELQSIGATSVAAVAALGLDFGAVDVLARYSDTGALRKHVVCEVNTAPGLEGQTLAKYVQAIRDYLTKE